MKSLKKKYPFHHCIDEKLEEYLQEANSLLKTLIQERDFVDFDVHIIMAGRTLIHLENEKEQRKTLH